MELYINPHLLNKMMMKTIQILIILLYISNNSIAQNRSPSISEQLLNSTIRIECNRDTIIDGTKRNIVSTGTGFFFSFYINGKDNTYIVTNAHVINNSKVGILRFTELLDSLPNYGHIVNVQISNFESLFIKHPTQDLAIIPLDLIVNNGLVLGKPVYFRSGSEKVLFTTQYDQKVDYIENAMMIGYPKGLYDSYNNLPIVRRGLTATPVQIDFQNQPKFLLDIPVYPGSSGSPVFIYDFSGSYPSKENGRLMSGSRLLLLGIATQSFNYPFSGEIINDSTGHKEIMTKLPINVAVVIKATELLAFIPIIKSKVKKDIRRPIRFAN
ncbi:Trypsin-like peptidase domain-containing protein [Pedobacter westerhofensis]|uniref:Trypsin-like peptidase domain-containing protein n=2 Tax=Pedobacter westerhofensis TaxID=425512 RepID=A0A521FUG0_9SPHI|nr:serine protease [Pedobacter westerhofensis]SMO99752.1 Trypsin-like peptidase domain-containing protein [Pedobacter westerhofensis]